MTDGAPFEAAHAALARSGDVPAWLRARRESAWARFAEQGFPSTRQEQWRFTNVAPIAQTSFRWADGVDALRPDAAVRELVEWLRFGGRCALVFINGRYSPELSCPWPDDAVRLCSLQQALAAEPERLEPLLGWSAGEAATPFASLNTALIEDGACVLIAPGRAVPTAISLVLLTTSREQAPLAAHPRVIVVAGRGSQATVVEAYGGPQGETYFANGLTEVILEEGAILDHVRVQRESEAAFHVATVAVRQRRDSHYRSIALDLGAALARTDIDVRLEGEGGECELDGLFVVGGRRHSDTHTRIEHAQPHTTSREIYRGILDGQARGVFHGLILVRPGAQKTDAFQLNKNLILSRQALVNSTPQLQIHADDVRCKHGSTTGQMDAEALFYLRSRGIGEEAARSLLVHAFASDIVSRVGVASVRASIEALLDERLPGAPKEDA